MLLRTLFVVLSVLVQPAWAAEPVTVRFGTATQGGGFQVYGAAFAEAVRAVDAGITFEMTPTKGSAENVPMLEAGTLDIALVQGETAYEALNGIGRSKTGLRVLSAMYSSPGMFAVPAQSPVRTIADLKGKAIALGASGSGLVTLARYVLDGAGFDVASDFKTVLLEKAGDGPAMVADGRVAALWGGGAGWPGFTAIAKSSGGARFIVPSADEIARIQTKYPFLKKLVVPAGMYPGQTEPLLSVGSYSFVMVRPGVDEALVARIARALHRAEAELAQRLPVAAETTAQTTLGAVTSVDVLHPGVVRYFREAGVMP